MNDKVSQAIVDAAEKLGFAAERVWPQIVMLTWLNSLFWSIVDPIVILVGLYVGIRMIRSTYRVLEQNKTAYFAAKAAAGNSYVSSLDYDSMERVMLCALVVVVLAFICAAAIVDWPHSISGAIYPEARAVLNLAGK